DAPARHAGALVGASHPSRWKVGGSGRVARCNGPGTAAWRCRGNIHESDELAVTQGTDRSGLFMLHSAVGLRSRTLESPDTKEGRLKMTVDHVLISPLVERPGFVPAGV